MSDQSTETAESTPTPSADQGAEQAPEPSPEDSPGDSPELSPEESTDEGQEGDPEGGPEGGPEADPEGDTMEQGGDQEDQGDSEPPVRRSDLEREGDIAADYLEELLEIADLDGDLDMDVEGDRATVSIVGANLPQLVGANGDVLDALQELTRLAVYLETGERSRLMLDVSGHRAGRRAALEETAREVAARVKESGEAEPLDPMTPFERKVVHDAVAAAGLTTESAGVEPRRYVVVLPA